MQAVSSLKALRVSVGVGQSHLAKQLDLPQQYASVLEQVDLGAEWTERYLRALLEIVSTEGASCWAASGKGTRGCGCGPKKASRDGLSAVREPDAE